MKLLALLMLSIAPSLYGMNEGGLPRHLVMDTFGIVAEDIHLGIECTEAICTQCCPTLPEKLASTLSSTLPEALAQTRKREAVTCIGMCLTGPHACNRTQESFLAGLACLGFWGVCYACEKAYEYKEQCIMSPDAPPRDHQD